MDYNMCKSNVGRVLFFYEHAGLSICLQGVGALRVVRSAHHLLGCLDGQQAARKTTLLATDAAQSVLCQAQGSNKRMAAYSPYGFDEQPIPLIRSLGFNGQLRESNARGYLLGAGYRLYGPVLMRFYSADSWSPFRHGGINAYTYCSADPVNWVDPSGHMKRSTSPPSIPLPHRPRSRTTSDASSASMSIPSGTPLGSPGSTPPGSPRGVRSAFDSRRSPSSTPDFIGRHGATDLDEKSLMGGLSSSHMNSASGLSGGAGFYVAPTEGMASEFAQMAARYKNEGNPAPQATATPATYYVMAHHFNKREPGKDYRFSTMGVSGLGRIPGIQEMELVLKENMYSSVRIRKNRPLRRQIWPRASEAPF